MSDIDKKLEELLKDNRRHLGCVTLCGPRCEDATETLRDAAHALAAALLRARKALADAEGQLDRAAMERPPESAYYSITKLRAALADTELEEALG